MNITTYQIGRLCIQKCGHDTLSFTSFKPVKGVILKKQGRIWIRKYSNYSKMYPFNPDERNIYADSFDHDIRLDTKEGQQVVDFVQELAIDNNFTPVVHKILSYLTPKDLTSFSCVNKSWKRVVQSDTISSHRKKAYLKELRDRKARIGKENFLPTQYLNNRTPLNGFDSKPSLINRQKLFVKKRKESDENNTILKISNKEGLLLKTKKRRKKENTRSQITMFR